MCSAGIGRELQLYGPYRGHICGAKIGLLEVGNCSAKPTLVGWGLATKQDIWALPEGYLCIRDPGAMSCLVREGSLGPVEQAAPNLLNRFNVRRGNFNL